MKGRPSSITTIEEERGGHTFSCSCISELNLTTNAKKKQPATTEGNDLVMWWQQKVALFLFQLVLDSTGNLSLVTLSHHAISLFLERGLLGPENPPILGWDWCSQPSALQLHTRPCIDHFVLLFVLYLYLLKCLFLLVAEIEVGLCAKMSVML